MNQDDLLSEFKREFLADFRADSEWRKNKKEDGDFYDGKQWDEEDAQKLRERGQPAIVINRVKPKMDGIFGIQQALRVDTKFYPQGEREREAEAATEYWRRIEDQSDFDTAESDFFEDMAIDGRGWYRLSKEWDGLKSCHKVERVDNGDVIPDRNSKRDDLEDAKRVHFSVWSSVEDAKKLFPGFSQEIENSALKNTEPFTDDVDSFHRRIRPDQYRGGSDVAGMGFTSEDFGEFNDKKNRYVRIVTTFYRELSPKRFYVAPGMETAKEITDEDDKSIETLKAAFPEGEVFTEYKKRLNSCTFTWGVILEQQKDIRPWSKRALFPFVQAVAYRERGSKIPYGLIRQMKDPQREINKRRSKLLHLLNVNRTIFEKGAFQDEEAARAQIARPDTWLAKERGFEVQIQGNVDVAASQFQLLQQATREVDLAGVNQEVEGRSVASSGREFQLRQQTAVQPIRKLFASLRAARKRVAEYILEEFVHEYPEIALSTYDVVIEEAPDTINLQGETFETLAQLAMKGLQIPPDLLIENSPLPTKSKGRILEALRAPQTLPAGQQGTPEEVAALSGSGAPVQ